MTEKKDTCVNLPLASRRRLAVRAVRDLKSTMMKMATEDQQREVKEDDELLEKIPNEDSRAKVAELMRKMDADVEKAADILYKAFWQTGVSRFRSLLGDDAVDFALKTVKGENS